MNMLSVGEIMEENIYLKDKLPLWKDAPEPALINFVLALGVILMCVVLVFVCFFQLCFVIGASMEDTVQNNDNVLLTRYDSKLKSGDIIVLDVARQFGEPIRVIKRLIGTEGQIFMFTQTGGVYYLNQKQADGVFKRLTEDYIKEPMTSLNSSYFRLNEEFTVPKDRLLFLGDNRNNSSDSRAYGFGETSAVVGKVVLRPKKGSLLEHFLNLIFRSSETRDEPA
jgi:signal peptidase I